MDPITYSSTSSLSSSSYQHQISRKITKSSQPLNHNSLHSVRKPLQKPTPKHFIAPLPPTPPKIYDVDVSNFKEVVRALTSSPEFHNPSARRLKDIAPPPLVLSTIPKPTLFSKQISEDGGNLNKLPTFMMSPDFCKFLNETLDTTRFISETPEMNDPLRLSLSPNSLSWCSSLILSPL